MFTAKMRWAFIALVLLGAILRLCIAWSPMEWLLRHVLCDDSFYYLTIARTLARRGVCSFDGTTLTNGFHPLWLALITPLFWIQCIPTQSVHLVLTLCALCDIFALVLLARLLRFLNMSAESVLVVVALYALSPGLFSYTGALNGMDTSLNTAVLCALLTSYMAIQLKLPLRIASPAAFGMLCGFSFLARTDSGIIAAVLLISVLVTQRGGIRFALATMIAAIAIVTPWLYWNMSTFGTVLQVSGEAYAFATRELTGAANWGIMEYGARAVKNLADVFRFFPETLGLETKYSVGYAAQSLACASACCAAAYTVYRKAGAPAELIRTRMRLLAGPLLASTAFVLVHSVKSINLRGWYYATALPPLWVALAALVDMGFSRHSRRLIRFFSLLPVILALLLGIWSVSEDAFHHDGEIEKFLAIDRMRHLLPPEAKVGSWNAGVYGYFYDMGQIVDLDGLVNNAVFPYIRHRSLGTYCVNNHIEFLVDAPGTFKVWDSFWAQAPGGLLRSITPVGPMSDRELKAPILIAQIVSPFIPQPIPP